MVGSQEKCDAIIRTDYLDFIHALGSYQYLHPHFTTNETERHMNVQTTKRSANSPQRSTMPDGRTHSLSAAEFQAVETAAHEEVVLAAPAEHAKLRLQPEQEGLAGAVEVGSHPDRV